VIENQIIRAEPIKESPRVISRTFIQSELEYYPKPPARDNIFQLRINVTPTVIINHQNPIVIKLPKFRRIDSLIGRKVHLSGANNSLIEESMADWNQTSEELSFKPPSDQVIPASLPLQLMIQEAQGFILPAELRANDTRILIESRGPLPIPPEPVKISPMVGNGPYTGHLFCMRQYERGIRTQDGRCDVGPACQPPNPPLEDPCSADEMIRCDCAPLTEEPVNITVEGFQLQPTDTLRFIPYTQLCSADAASSGTISSFSPPEMVHASPENSWLAYENISSVDSGYYRICMVHVGQVYDVGMVIVRPSCKSPLVLVDGVCVNDCPKTKVPIAGDCLRDPNATMPEERQALMLPIKIDDPSMKRDLANAPFDDPERKYFIYRFIYDLASLLNCDSKRIHISSLSNGSVIVNTIFAPAVIEEKEVTTTYERSPKGLISLFQRLQADTSSAMYAPGSLFKDIVRDYPGPLYTPVKVRRCPSDNEYRVFCPYVPTMKYCGSKTPGAEPTCEPNTVMSTGATLAWYWLMQIGIILGVVILCCGVWRIDADRHEPIDEDILDKLTKDPKLVEPVIRLEFAKSWMDGRFMGEKWQKEREKSFMALGH
jgi:hypothetical protein